MKNMNAATLKKHIKNQNEIIRGIRIHITDLKWKPEAKAQIAEIRRLRRQTLTAKGVSLKPFRRPETGQMRYTLWDNKRLEGDTARYLMLAYGALRGRTYKSMEANCGPENGPSVWNILQAIEEYGGPAAGSWTRAAVTAWLAGGPAPMTWHQARLVMKAAEAQAIVEARV